MAHLDLIASSTTSTFRLRQRSGCGPRNADEKNKAVAARWPDLCRKILPVISLQPNRRCGLFRLKLRGLMGAKDVSNGPVGDGGGVRASDRGKPRPEPARDADPP